MAESPEDKPYAAAPELAQYVLDLFNPEDEILARVRERARRAGLPEIHVSPFDGRLLELIARAVNPSLIVEIGTLAGYSGICLARALAPSGVLHTLEIDPAHARVARESFFDAGLDDRISIHLGPARKALTLFTNSTVDLVFVDADKASYPEYVRWASRALRIGGVILADNAFGFGLVPDGPFKNASEEASIRALDFANQILADSNGAFRSMMIPTSEGLAFGVRVR